MAEVAEPIVDEVADAEEEAVELEEEVEEEEDFVAVGATEVKLFGKWSSMILKSETSPLR